MTDTPIPAAAARLQAIIKSLTLAHKQAQEAAEGDPDGIVLVDGATVGINVRRLQKLAQDMIDGSEDAPLVFADKTRPSLHQIAQVCAETFEVPYEKLVAQGKTGGATHSARQAYCLIARRIHGKLRSYPQIAKVIGAQCHSSVIHNFRTGQLHFDTNKEFHDAVRTIERRLMGG